MDETVLKIAIAAFMHDIGKLADESAFHVSAQYLLDNADLYQPFFKGRHTHRHAVNTAAFIEYLEKLLPSKLSWSQWGLGDSFINLAAGHHKPQTPMQWVIAIADRLSSGWDRERFEDEYNQAVPWREYRKTRMLPVFEQLMCNDHELPKGKGRNDYQYCYPLKTLSPENMFASSIDALCPETDEKAAAEYKDLFEQFVFSLEHLFHKEENLELWFEHFESLMMVFTSTVPSARAGNVIPDVSLYDHSKTTAALAVGLYLYHVETGTVTVEAIRNYSDKKFLLITGDFHGIQNFIFCDSGEARRYRSKILRGRSFAVSLFSELAADLLCREIGIPSCSVVFDAAGKFTVIAPNTEKAREAMTMVEAQVNDWLTNVSFGENAIGIGAVEASPNDFVNVRFGNLWEELGQTMEVKKCRKIDIERFGGVFSGYLDGFRSDLKHPLCPFCGKRPSDPQVEGSALIGQIGSACRVCWDHIFLGTHLVKGDRVAVTTLNAEIRDDKKMLESIYEVYQVAFVKGALSEIASTGQLLKYWDISIDPSGRIAKGATAKFINAYVPVYRAEDFNDERLLAGSRSEDKKVELIDEMEKGSPKTFGHIANKALNRKQNAEGFCGIEALGVLVADVDELGLLMSCGLRSESFSISRLATLSRQINFYFAFYLPHLLQSDQRFMNIYTVFAGGDDLFLIGPWNRVVELAGFLRRSFAEYVCQNPNVHFSAGITIHKPHTPLDKLADGAKVAIDKSKDEGRNRLTLFSETVEWEEFSQLSAVRNILQNWLDSKLLNNAMLYRINDFIKMATLEKLVLQDREISLEDMACFKWYSLFNYMAERNVGKGLKGEERKKAIEDFSKAAVWLDQYRGKLRIPLWDVIYNQR